MPPIIQYTTVSKYDKSYWTDMGSHARSNVSAFTPEVPTGGCILGMYAQGNYDPPRGTCVIITGVESDDPKEPALTAPELFEPFWWYSKNDSTHILWWARPKRNYVACGSVATETKGKVSDPKDFPQPTLPFMCVRQDLCVQIPKEDLTSVWNDNNSHNSADASIWKVRQLNTMISNNNKWDPPFPVWIPNNLPALLPDGD